MKKLGSRQALARISLAQKKLLSVNIKGTCKEYNHPTKHQNIAETSKQVVVSKGVQPIKTYIKPVKTYIKHIKTYIKRI